MDTDIRDGKLNFKNNWKSVSYVIILLKEKNKKTKNQEQHEKKMEDRYT